MGALVELGDLVIEWLGSLSDSSMVSPRPYTHLIKKRF